MLDPRACKWCSGRPMADLPTSGAGDANALFAKAVGLHQSGKAEAAIALYEQVVALAPEHAPAHMNLAVAFRGLRRLDQALASYDRAVALRPDDPDLHNSRGNTLSDLGRLEDALAAYDRALAARPDHPNAHYNRGNTLVRLDRIEEGVASYDRAVALRGDFADAFKNRGVALRRLGRTDEALASFDCAIALKPDFSDAYWNRSFCHLARGRFAEGWADYERRWDLEAFVRQSASHTTPAMRGRFDAGIRVEDLAGAHVLLVDEQGVGDVLMFASIIPELAAAAASVSLACDRRLWRLFASSFPELRLLDPETATRDLSRFDRVMAIGSLGRLYRRRIEDFPGAAYLTASSAARDRWAARLGPRAGRARVGVSWRGGIARTGQARRSLALAELQPILDLPGCEFVSLQYGENRAEVDAVNARLAHPVRLFEPAEIEDFEDLAALVQNLDLVVSVQTALVHLAGALGAPCLVMVPQNPEWRYMDGAPTMPWYGSVALFRQGDDRDWSPVVRRVAEAVAQRCELAA